MRFTSIFIFGLLISGSTLLALSIVPPACFQPKDSGNCYAAFRHFYYNVFSGQCEMFIYGGCGGNANNFETLPACINTCMPYKGYRG